MIKREMHLSKLDDLFTTQDERNKPDIEKIQSISIKDIDDFQNHPFQLNIDEDILDSIRNKGVITPIIVRPKNGKYELISGHRRKKASEILGLSTIPCIVRELTDDEAIIAMVDSNYQRTRILPSEKAFAYKLKMEALNHQGERTDLTSCQLGRKLSSAKKLGDKFGDSERKVYRYIRLTYLLPKLLEYVDNSIIKDKEVLSIALSPAIEISYLTKDEQEMLLDYIELNQITPSQSQAINLRNLSQDHTFTVEKMKELLNEQKPNETPMLKVSMNRLRNVLPHNLQNDKDRAEYIIEAVQFYVQYQKRRQKSNKLQR